MVYMPITFFFITQRNCLIVETHCECDKIQRHPVRFERYQRYFPLPWPFASHALLDCCQTGQTHSEYGEKRSIYLKNRRYIRKNSRYRFIDES
ncbi:hypothetical protein DJ94_4690 [Bacillus pseudomycoides]|nr:hypothetical protein DJ94_4690 [Bacillus pseudomycoides]